MGKYSKFDYLVVRKMFAHPTKTFWFGLRIYCDGCLLVGFWFKLGFILVMDFSVIGYKAIALIPPRIQYRDRFLIS